jgi:hypothetical protein
LSAEGDPLERLTATVDFKIFLPVPRTAFGRSAGGKGGLPAFDPVLKFKMLVLQSLHGLSLAQTSYMVRDRLSWMRFCGLEPPPPPPGPSPAFAGPGFGLARSYIGLIMSPLATAPGLRCTVVRLLAEHLL